MSRADELRIRDYLGHILDAIIRNFEIIGEACHNVERYHPDFAAKHPAVPWVVAYEMRNTLAHGYFLVDMEVVWRTIQTDLPSMVNQINRLLKSENAST